MKRGWIVFLTLIALALAAVFPYRVIISGLASLLPTEDFPPVKEAMDGLLSLPDFVLPIVLTLLTAFVCIYFGLAPNNCSFTFVSEGTAKFVYRGKKFAKCLMQWENYMFDKENTDPIEKWNIIKRTRRGGFRGLWDLLMGLFGGLRLYGLWPLWDIHIYKFHWTGVTVDGEVDKKTQWLDYMILKEDVYLCVVSEAEDRNQLPLEIQLYLTIRIVNTYKARFRVQNWLETVINRMQPLIRQYVATETYEDLGAKMHTAGEEMKKELEKAKLVGEYEKPDGTLVEKEERGEFINLYGVWIRAIEVRQVNPPKLWREATLTPYKATLERQATETKAEGEATRIEIVYGKLKEYGDLGQLIRTLEAVEKSTLAASLTVQAIPGIQEILRGVFGKPVGEVTQSEITKLRETIERLIEKEERTKRG